MKFFVLLITVFCFSCTTQKRLHLPAISKQEARTTGTQFYKNVAAAAFKQRDSIAVNEILSGNIPSFLKRLVPVTSTFTDSLDITHKAVLYVLPDYLSLGTDEDWARLSLTPMAAQVIADSLHCFLPTKKIVDLIYEQATIKLEPVPMYAFRDSSPTMYQHHLIIEGQRKQRKGLIAGIKKDVVLSGKLLHDAKPQREAIYGWHKPDGKPIQPLYTGHINWWVDYSHGIRLVYRKLKVDGKWMDYVDVLKHPVLSRLICDEVWCDCYRY